MKQLYALIILLAISIQPAHSFTVDQFKNMCRIYIRAIPSLVAARDSGHSKEVVKALMLSSIEADASPEVRILLEAFHESAVNMAYKQPWQSAEAETHLFLTTCYQSAEEAGS